MYVPSIAAFIDSQNDAQPKDKYINISGAVILLAVEFFARQTALGHCNAFICDQYHLQA